MTMVSNPYSKKNNSILMSYYINISLHLEETIRNSYILLFHQKKNFSPVNIILKVNYFVLTFLYNRITYFFPFKVFVTLFS